MKIWVTRHFSLCKGLRIFGSKGIFVFPNHVVEEYFAHKLYEAKFEKNLDCRRSNYLE